ncbi:MAG: 3-dehydroquinate synthase [uncultured Chthoniobacterales bacterium]|uniref:3-dehydroquinate synthase n=1 Tax=uncultured Chthoniobacterales bacterium TaxID=1836801 RepID=A0A6J4GZK9_9BACT|nr:MAG: 3-dehydroquinate synthase [uncultured Chthoniobacterales bacterium]
MNAVSVRAGDVTYEAHVGSGLLAEIGSLLRDVVRGPRCALVADANTARLFAEPVTESLRASGFEPTLIKVPAGEMAKSLSQAGRVCDEMTAAGLDRSSFVVAVGGGVIGDLAGFAAAIYHRGIPHVQVPTTLLAQVDSSIGGKTGVNTRAGKNLLGAVHQPALVVADVETLRSLPRRELNQGFAEIIKHAIIRDPSLFDVLEHFDPDKFAELVHRNIEIKAAVVARDEHDLSGERAILNFGHTVGHAIERATGYDRFLHGEAVSLGIVAACDISVRKAGFPPADRDKVIHALTAFDLPTRLPDDVDRAAIADAVAGDKKFEHGDVRFVVVEALGAARLATDVTMRDITSAIAAL